MGNNLSSTKTTKQRKVKSPKKRFSLSSKEPNNSNGLRRLSLGSNSNKSKLGLDSNNKRGRRRSSDTSNGSFRRLKAKMTLGTKKQKKSKKHASTTDQIMDKLNPNTTTAETSRRKSMRNPFKKNTPPPKKNKILNKLSA